MLQHVPINVHGLSGQLECMQVHTDSRTGRSKGYGYATYTDPQSVQHAIDLAHDMVLDGRMMIVMQYDATRFQRSCVEDSAGLPTGVAPDALAQRPHRTRWTAFICGLPKGMTWRCASSACPSVCRALPAPLAPGPVAPCPTGLGMSGDIRIRMLLPLSRASQRCVLL